MFTIFLVILFVFSVMLLSCGIWMMTKQRNCKYKLNAALVEIDKVEVHYRGHINIKYIPIFRYEYNGYRYEGRGFISISKKEIKKYLPEKTYVIYINPYKPKDFVVTQKIDSSTIFLITLGVLFSVVALILSLV